LEEDLAKDVLEIMTVFYARLYGSRSQKNKALIKDLKQACEKHVFGKVLYQDPSYFRK
jgi:putative resolvase